MGKSKNPKMNQEPRGAPKPRPVSTQITGLVPMTIEEAITSIPVGIVTGHGTLPAFVHKTDPEVPETIELADAVKVLTETMVELAPRRLPPPDDDGFHYSRRIKNPAVVLRTDGRYGVARGAFFDEPRKYCDAFKALGLAGNAVVHPAGFHRLLGKGVFNTTGTSGFTHEPTTYRTRGEAEKRAWALAREIGDITDWP